MTYSPHLISPTAIPVAVIAIIVVATLPACSSTPSPIIDGDATNCAATDDYQSLAGCNIVDGDLVLENLDKERLSALAELVHVEGSLKIRQNVELSELDDLQFLQSVGGDLQLVTLPKIDSLQGLKHLDRVGGDIHVVDLAVAHCRADRWANGVDVDGGVELIGLLDDPGACASDPDESTEKSLPVTQLPELDQMRRGDLLEGVHPELRRRIKLMYALLEKEGIEIVFVSGHRPLAGFSKPNRLASWHNVGMAVDLNLAHRASLQDSTDHYDEDEDKWERIGEIAKGLGIIWGARYDDIFHFEWHPGYHSRIREHELQEFKSHGGSNLSDHDEAWHLFDAERADPTDPECFGGCYHIPDDGLRSLMEHLR